MEAKEYVESLVEKARAAVYTRTCEIIRSFRIEGNQEKLFG